MKVLVAAAGAIGQWLGTRLHEGGHDVTLWTTPRHAAAIARSGLCLRGETSLCWEPQVVTSAPATPDFDAIVLTAKANRTTDLAREIAPLAGRGAPVASLQNGFGNGAKLARFVPAGQIVLALTSHGVTMEEPGTVRHHGAGPTIVGPSTPASEAAARSISGLLADASLTPRLEQDMRPFVWRKALVNHAVNPIGAVHAANNGQLLEPALWREVDPLVEEGFALSRAAGVALPGGGLPALRDAIRETLERTRDNRNSMVQDVAARRPTEIEQISGRLVRLARRLGHPAVASEQAYRKVKALEASYLGEERALALAREESEWESDPF